MRRLLKKAIFWVSLASFGASLSSVFQYWDYEEALVDITKQLKQQVSTQEITKEIEQALQQSRFDEARMYLSIATSNHYPINVQHYQERIAEKDTAINHLAAGIKHFSEGFIQGKSDNAVGLVGSVSADFTVVGDARDLYQQYQRFSENKPVNELVVVLSGVGVGLTVLTIGSAGSTAPAKAGTSMIKVAAKTQKLSRPFQKLLLKQGRKIFDWPLFTRRLKQNKSIKHIKQATRQAYHPEAVKPLKEIATSVNNIRKSTSSIDAIQLLKYVDDGNDLRQLEKVSVKYGAKTKGLLKLVGKGALRTVKVLKKTTELMVSIISSLLSALLSIFLFFVSKKS